MKDFTPEKTKGQISSEQKIWALKGILLQALLTASQLVTETLLQYQLNGSEDIQDQLKKAMSLMEEDSEVYWNTLDNKKIGRTLDSFLEKIEHLKNVPEEYTTEMLDLGQTYPVMHPAAITEELLKRIKELLVKVLSTQKIIVAGGVMLNKENNHGDRESGGPVSRTDDPIQIPVESR